MDGSIDLGAQLGGFDAVAQAELVRTGQVSARELVQAAISAAERIDPVINAVIHRRYERALAEADYPGLGPFAGVPTAMKDLGGAMAGEPLHMGCRALKALGHRAERDSFAYRRLRRAGFVAIGRTNVPEWGSTVTTEPLAYGPTRNPWALGHSAGGSSGGSAAVVASGIVAVAHASDGGGSIRIPASACGLVGLKPSRGRVSAGPDLHESWSGWSTQGALTRTVRDAAAVLDVLAGYETGDPYVAPGLARPLADEVGADPGRLRVGFLHTSPNAAADAECVTAVEKVARLLEALGHHVEPSAPPGFNDPEMSRRFLVAITAYTRRDTLWLQSLLGRPPGPEDLEHDNLVLGAMGAEVGAAQLLDALAGQGLWARQVMSWWQPGDGAPGFDVLLTPVLNGTPPPIGAMSGRGGAARFRELMQFTSQLNVTGQPAISLPVHTSADGLPVGVQLVADYGREDVLVRLAAQIEAASPWPVPPWMPAAGCAGPG